MTESSVWQVQLLGGFQVRHGNRSVSRFKTYKTAALLARLALFAERSHSREELIGLLWPDADIEAGRGSLRTALAALRRQLTQIGGSAPDMEPPLCADRLQVYFPPGRVSVDVAEFEAAVKAAERTAGVEQVERLTEALDLYRGELLPGYHEEWIISERERLSLRYRATLRRLISAWEERGDLPQALEAAQRAGSLFPADEEIQRPLIQLYAQTGRLDEARRQFQVLEQILWDEDSGPPCQATRALVAALPAGDKAGGKSSLFSGPPGTPLFPPLLLPLTRFFGRSNEMDHVGALLRRRDVRLVTLTGPGGAGKTRLALQVARHLTGFFQGAIVFVGLADLTDGSEVLEALADALHLTLQADFSPVEQVVAALGGQPALLILDNLEQIAGSAAPWIERLLMRAPRLTCLATSRQRLDIPGEREFPVPSLPVPSPAAREPNTLAGFPGVQLFLDRAQAAMPEFQITPQNAAAVAALCERLEGIPLALELAAAWVPMFTPAQMLVRMEDRFSLLVSRRRMPARHRTLHAAIDWSHRLLSPGLQRFFGQLSVFRGGWSLEAAESVCEEPEALDMLARLRSRSLLVTAEAGGVMRFQMLESLREFAADRLTECGAEDKARLARRHTQYFLHLAGEAQEALVGPDQISWLDRLEAEHANLRAVFDRCLAAPTGADTGIHLMSLLGRFWYTRGHWREQRHLLEVLLAHPGASVESRAIAFYQLGDAAGYLGDTQASEEAYSRCLALCEQRGDERGAAQCLRSLGRLAHNRGDYIAGRSFFERCLSLRRAIGEVQDIADALQNLGRLVQAQGDSAAADALFAESLSLARQKGNTPAAASVLTELAKSAIHRNCYDEAQALLEERLTIVRHLGNWSAIANTLMNLGRLAKTQNQAARALSLVEEAVSVYRTLAHQEALADAVKHMGEIAASCGETVRAEAAFQESSEILRRLAGTGPTPEKLPH